MIFARPYKFLRNGGYTRSSNKKEECICLENTMQKTGLRRGLTTAQLKWIALVLMVLDHIHYFFEFTGAVPLLFSQLGRLSAGLFLFCLIEGFIHTHDRRRYFLRIYLVSVGMGAVQFCCILFDFCRRPDGFYPMNQMLATFAVLLPMLQGVDWLRQKRSGRIGAAFRLAVFHADGDISDVPAGGRLADAAGLYGAAHAHHDHGRRHAVYPVRPSDVFVPAEKHEAGGAGVRRILPSGVRKHGGALPRCDVGFYL